MLANLPANLANLANLGGCFSANLANLVNLSLDRLASESSATDGRFANLANLFRGEERYRNMGHQAQEKARCSTPGNRLEVGVEGAPSAGQRPAPIADNDATQ